jgi:ABC-type sugar transport system ATPase subunit
MTPEQGRQNQPLPGMEAASENRRQDTPSAAPSRKKKRGEVVGLTGLVGAGRTELARALFGADPVGSGRVALDRKEATQERIMHFATGGE